MGGMRYHVELPRGRALLAALTGRGADVGTGAVQWLRADGMRQCCDTRPGPGNGHLSDCLAPPGSVLRAEITRQEKSRPPA